MKNCPGFPNRPGADPWMDLNAAKRDKLYLVLEGTDTLDFGTKFNMEGML